MRALAAVCALVLSLCLAEELSEFVDDRLEAIERVSHPVLSVGAENLCRKRMMS